MPNVVLSVFTSLDGYYAGPNGEFVPPAWSDDMEASWAVAAMRESDHFIYGRVNFTFNRDFWTSSDAANIAHAGEMNAKPKTVFSRTLTGDPGWNATVVSDDLPGTVARLKATCRKDIFLFGSGNLADSFMKLDLIDEYRLLLTPSLMGSGRRLFGEGRPAMALQLVETRQIDTGAVVLRYLRTKSE